MAGDEGAERLTKKPKESGLDSEDEKSLVGFQKGRGVTTGVCGLGDGLTGWAPVKQRAL